jgi:hypothetical protein
MHPSKLNDVVDQEQALRVSGGSVCWDLKTELQAPGHTCDRLGFFRRGPTALSDLKSAITSKFINLAEAQLAFQWSEELAYSASRHIEKFRGCAVHPDLVLKDGGIHDDLAKFATFKDHARFTVVSERMPWADPSEFWFDFALDDGKESTRQVEAMLSVQYNQVGFSCSCHQTFGHICVVEFGREVRAKPGERVSAPWYPLTREYCDNKEAEFYRTNEHLPDYGFCSEVDNSNEFHDPTGLYDHCSIRRDLGAFPSAGDLSPDTEPYCPFPIDINWYNSNNLGLSAVDFFSTINQIRTNASAFISQVANDNSGP